MDVKSIVIAMVMLIASPIVSASDARMCGKVNRDVNGNIIRNATVLKNFKSLYVCPSTGKNSGSCPGWAIDHVIPLACGGCDSLENLQWLPNDIKSAKYPAKDRWERQIHSTGICTFKIQK